VATSGERVEREMQGGDSQECGSEQDSVVSERVWHRQCREEHRDQRGE
jgi:hypothetical protein